MNYVAFLSSLCTIRAEKTLKNVKLGQKRGHKALRNSNIN